MFYVWLKLLYTALFGLALWLNRKDWHMLGLAVAVAFGIFVPIPDASTASLWYFQCIIVELVVILAAVLMQAAASKPVVLFGVVSIAMHMTGISVGPQWGLSAYRLAIPMLEISQLLSCILLSQPALQAAQKLINRTRKS